MHNLHRRPPSHGHECDFILVRSGPFQKAGRREVAFTQEYRNKHSETVQNRFKIRMVRKSEPEIKPVRKRTIPFPYEQKKQVQFRSTFRTCWVSTGTRKCISLTFSQYIGETLFSFRSACVFIFSHNILNFNLSELPNSFIEIILPKVYIFFNFFNHKLSPFRRWSMNVVNCLEIFCMHVCIFGRIKKLQILFLGCLKKP